MSTAKYNTVNFDGLINFTTRTTNHTCPTCNSNQYIKNGKENGSQRYRCKKCRRNFRSTSQSSIYRLKKKTAVQTYISCLHQGLTLRHAAKESNISLKTAFLWRHRFLSALKQQPRQTINQHSLISTVRTKYSEKGSRKKQETANKKNPVTIIENDHRGKFRLYVFKTSQFSQNNRLFSTPSKHQTAAEGIPKCLLSGLSTKSTPLKNAAKKLKEQLICWLQKFRGVATKYLHNYWAWIEILSGIEQKHKEEDLLLEYCIKA